MLAIKCPYCAFVIELKGVRAGHFQPKCPRCAEKFGLVIHSDPAMQPTVTALSDKVDSDVAAALGIKESKPPQPAHTQHASSVPHATQTHSPHATSVGATSVPHASSPVQSNTAVMDAPPVGATSVPRAPVHASVPPIQADVPAAAAPAAHPTSGTDLNPGTALGGYEIIQKLGSGGMGAVYLARQVSLDRNVALKTLHQQLAQDPQLVARFTREAYAAAQLTHHNIVQIHDIGFEKDVNFFSMEFVSGTTLAHALREAGKIDTETAVAHVLQAARGLKFAHDHGLIHRDIKPENLLLNDQGIVKVADLGLVKKLGSHETENMQLATARDSGVGVTQVNKSMGTPLYMPPEQAVDAARVDHRADIYSLGCTLYHMVTGRPPFIGRTAMEVITKHQHEPVTPPDVVVKDVPAALSPIIGRMLAKRPEERYASMKDVIAALEGFLGVATAGPYTPKEDQVKILEFAADKFNKNPLARLRPKLIMAFYAACALLAVLLAYTAEGIVWKTNLAGGMIGLALLTTVVYQVTVGVMRGTFLFRKIRQLVFGAGIVDWLLWTVGLAVFVYVIYAFNLWVPWLFAAVLAVMLAQAFYWAIDSTASRQREQSLRQAEHLTKQMRLKGLDENAIRQFVCKFSGKHWEEFFEALFGYEAKLQARAIWGKERGKDRPKFAAWREPVIAFIEHRIESRKQIKEAKLLAKLEQRAMQAKGIDAKLARKQASKNAERLVSSADLMKRESEKQYARTLAPSAKETAAPGSKETAPPKDLSSTTMLAATIASGEALPDLEQMPGYVRESYLKRRYGTPLQMITSPMARFACALVLLAVFANWWSSNNVERVAATVNEVRTTRQEEATKVVASKDIKQATKVIASEADEALARSKDRPLTVWFIPDALLKPINPLSVLLAGVLLLLSVVCRGKLFGLTVYATAALALSAGFLKLPLLGQQMFVTSMLAVGVWVFSVIFLRVRHD